MRCFSELEEFYAETESGVQCRRQTKTIFFYSVHCEIRHDFILGVAVIKLMRDSSQHLLYCQYIFFTLHALYQKYYWKWNVWIFDTRNLLKLLSSINVTWAVVLTDSRSALRTICGNQTDSFRLRGLVWIYCPGHAGVRGESDDVSSSNNSFGQTRYGEDNIGTYASRRCKNKWHCRGKKCCVGIKYCFVGRGV